MRRAAAYWLFSSLVLIAVACGQPTPVANLPTLSIAPSPPRGGPLPAQLIGDWFLPPAAVNAFQESSGFGSCPSPLTPSTCLVQLSFTATTYNFSFSDNLGRTSGGGNAVVNATEIDFFNAPACGLPLPTGIGRYTWTLVGGVLQFVPLNQDQCPRAPLLANQSYRRTG
jgi:hypothetical protein